MDLPEVRSSFGHQPSGQSLQVYSSSRNWFLWQGTQTQQHLTLSLWMFFAWPLGHGREQTDSGILAREVNDLSGHWRVRNMLNSLSPLANDTQDPTWMYSTSFALVSCKFMTSYRPGGSPCSSKETVSFPHLKVTFIKYWRKSDPSIGSICGQSPDMFGQRSFCMLCNPYAIVQMDFMTNAIFVSCLYFSDNFSLPVHRGLPVDGLTFGFHTPWLEGGGIIPLARDDVVDRDPEPGEDAEVLSAFKFLSTGGRVQLNLCSQNSRNHGLRVLFSGWSEK